MTSNGCDYTEAVLARLLDGESGPQLVRREMVSAERIDEHVENCPVCAVRLRRARRLDAAVAVSAGIGFPEPGDSAEREAEDAMFAGVFAAVASEADGAGEPMLRRQRSSALRLILVAAAAATVAAALVVGLLVGRMLGVRDARSDLERVARGTAHGETANGRAGVSTSPAEDSAVAADPVTVGPAVGDPTAVNHAAQAVDDAAEDVIPQVAPAEPAVPRDWIVLGSDRAVGAPADHEEASSPTPRSDPLWIATRPDLVRACTPLAVLRQSAFDTVVGRATASSRPVRIAQSARAAAVSVRLRAFARLVDRIEVRGGVTFDDREVATDVVDVLAVWPDHGSIARAAQLVRSHPRALRVVERVARSRLRASGISDETALRAAVRLGGTVLDQELLRAARGDREAAEQVVRLCRADGVRPGRVDLLLGLWREFEVRGMVEADEQFELAESWFGGFADEADDVALASAFERSNNADHRIRILLAMAATRSPGNAVLLGRLAGSSSRVEAVLAGFGLARLPASADRFVDERGWPRGLALTVLATSVESDPTARRALVARCVSEEERIVVSRAGRDPDLFRSAVQIARRSPANGLLGD